jgi:hypothetical protein
MQHQELQTQEIVASGSEFRRQAGCYAAPAEGAHRPLPRRGESDKLQLAELMAEGQIAQIRDGMPGLFLLLGGKLTVRRARRLRRQRASQELRRHQARYGGVGG